MGFGPDVATIRCLGHGRIADRPGEGGGIAGHLVKEGFGAAQAQGNDPQEAALQIGDGVVKGFENSADPRY